jgi:hypothetical protein
MMNYLDITLYNEYLLCEKIGQIFYGNISSYEII